MTKTASKTKVAVTVGVLLAGGAAAFAMLNANVGSGYIAFQATCHDGSWIEADQFRHSSHAIAEGDFQFGYAYLGCQTSDYLRAKAEVFCEGRQNPQTGKTGVNSFKVSGRCELPRAYGYGYSPTPPTSYGYNNAVNKLKQAVPSSASQRN